MHCKLFNSCLVSFGTIKYRYKNETFFANRVAGCSIHPDRYGFALYANHWQTADRALELDVGDDEKPCHHKSSGPGALKYGKWIHIALIVDVNQDDDTITYSAYIDKQLK